MFSDFNAANRDGLSRKERMRAMQSVMDSRSYRSLIQEILEEIDQDEQEPDARFNSSHRGNTLTAPRFHAGVSC
jgi:hypothetical protein